MKVKPVKEQQVDKETQKSYQLIKKALELPSTPLFFQYLGSFPKYLDYLTDQIVKNLTDDKFKDLTEQNSSFVEKTLKESFPKKEMVVSFLNKYQQTPQLYNLKEDLKHIFIVNDKLVFVFIALREAVKGYMVASKKLPSFAKKKESVEDTSGELKKEIVFKEHLSWLKEEGRSSLSKKSQSIIKKDKQQITQALLPEYLKLCQMEFNNLLKEERFLFFRVELEKTILNNLNFLPHQIVSPVNIVYKLTKEYEDFPELLYLISDHFPTYAVQKLLFSGWILY